MTTASIFDWVPFYKEFAQILYTFGDKRKLLVDKVNSVIEEAEKASLEVFNIDPMKDNLDSIDPFTVFALFNRGLKQEKRIAIIEIIKKEFNVKANTPTSFNSLPVVMMFTPRFYNVDESLEASKRRQIIQNDIDILWNLFNAAMEYTSSQDDERRTALETSFNAALKINGIAYGKVTMGFYWLDPSFYMNLDSRNTWYIYDTDKSPAGLRTALPPKKNEINGELYLEILTKVKEYISTHSTEIESLSQLSYDAWLYSEQVNQENAQKEKNDGLGSSTKNEMQYWIYSPGEKASNWDSDKTHGIMSIGWSDMGDLMQIKNKTDLLAAVRNFWGNQEKSYKNDKLCLWQFSREIKIGDIVFAKKGMSKIIGYGIVKSDYIYDNQQEKFMNIRNVEWRNTDTEVNLDNKVPMKTLTNITRYKELVKKIMENYDESETNDRIEPIPAFEEQKDNYGKDDFLEEVFMERTQYDQLVKELKRKKNIILQGAPGVGKTFMAKRLAYSIIGEKDDERVKLVQFHQGYSYEDFIMGFKPTKTGFEIHNGSFYEFCESAKDDEDNDYFFIIDEINRGNTAKIFGELFMLIENDKRGDKNRVTLPYESIEFFVPSNVHIIGMMNTADRSLAMIDYALRRRFSFFDIQPAFTSTKFQEQLSPMLSKLVSIVAELNEVIANDETLGDGFRIGHSYFCMNKELVTEQTVQSIVNFELIPLLKEYWFDDRNKVTQWSQRLQDAIK